MNDETRPRTSAGQPRICVNEGIVYMAPAGYTPIGLNDFGEMLAMSPMSEDLEVEIMVLPKVGRQVAAQEGDL